ncbi:MAG TPA: hypothetical protein VM285_17680 [Polyangia bacterium]|nr:hypothetical protein [Polyangia bacterium]
MNRGVSSKAQRGGGSEIKLPPGVHSIDGHGNIFASLPELSRVQPKFFTFDQIRAAFQAGQLTALNEDQIKEIEGLVVRK